MLSTMVLLSTLLRFWQEFRSNKAAEELKAMVRSTTAVLRAGMDRPQEIPISALVPGDIVCLSAGDMIPADVRVLAAKDLFVSQAMLTGEAIPVEKHAMPHASACGHARSPAGPGDSLLYGFQRRERYGNRRGRRHRRNHHFGAMAKDIAGARPFTSFDKGISRVSWMLIRFHPRDDADCISHQWFSQGQLA